MSADLRRDTAGCFRSDVKLLRALLSGTLLEAAIAEIIATIADYQCGGQCACCQRC
jgi:hypothetical protein